MKGAELHARHHLCKVCTSYASLGYESFGWLPIDEVSRGLTATWTGDFVPHRDNYESRTGVYALHDQAEPAIETLSLHSYIADWRRSMRLSNARGRTLERCFKVSRISSHHCKGFPHLGVHPPLHHQHMATTIGIIKLERPHLLFRCLVYICL